MPFIGGMKEFVFEDPGGLVEGGKVNVALEGGVNDRQIETVRSRQRQPIDLAAADHEDFGLGGAKGQRLVQIGNHGDPGGMEVGIAGDDHVAAIGERPADFLERLPPHHHGVVDGEPLEMLDFVREVPGQPAIPTDDPVLGHGGDERDDHTATGAEMCGWGAYPSMVISG